MPPLRTLLLPLTALVGMALVIWAGSQPDYWMLRAMPVGREAVYPLKPVLIFCAIVLAECVLLLAVLRPRSFCRSWGRALCASVLVSNRMPIRKNRIVISWPKIVLHLGEVICCYRAFIPPSCALSTDAISRYLSPAWLGNRQRYS